MQLIEWKYPRSRMVFKAYRENHFSPLPVDLMPMSLYIRRTPDSVRESLILDTDHYIEDLCLPCDWQIPEAQIRQLQEPMSQVFKAAISDQAVQRYME